MSATTHHEIHPDAEILSAFAEQALSAKDRGQVIEHLAVCGRCREILTLTSEASGAEVVATRHENAPPRGWWRTWGLVLAPAAAVAATALIAVSVYQRDVERKAEVARLERQQAIKKPPVLPQAPLQPTPEAAPAAAPSNAPTEPQKIGRTAVAKRAPVSGPDEMAVAPPAVMNGMFPAIGGPVENSEFERRRKIDEASPPSGASPDDTIPNAAAAYDEERKKHVEEESEVRRQFVARTPVPSSEHGSGDGAPGSSAASNIEPASVSEQQLEAQPAPTAGSLQLHGLSSMMDVATGPYAFHLPSGLPAISSASADHRTLAIDEKGTLFVREDSGGAWEKVKRQWTGRAIAVRRHANALDTKVAAPAPQTAGEPSDSGPLSQPDTVFELVNDQSQVWFSIDGRVWTTK